MNHVVYFGDGVSRKTVLRGFKITGANNFTTGSGDHSPIESDDVRKTPFFYPDGGGIKIYARSYPTIEQVEVSGNYTSPCGGGVSVEHLGQAQESVLFRNCIFRNNRTQITGSALDLLHGSRATLENCLFVGNVANLGVDYVGLLTGGEYHPEHGSGAMTVFEGSRRRSAGARSPATGTAWTTTAPEAPTWTRSSGRTRCAGGISAGPALRARHRRRRRRARIVHSRRRQRSAGAPSTGTANTFDPPDPRFDAQFAPRAPEYAAVGYRPVKNPPCIVIRPSDAVS